MNKLSWALLLVLLPSVILAVNFLQDAGNRGWRLTQRQFFGVFPTPETEPFSVYDYYYNSPQSCLPDSIIRSREGEVDLIFPAQLRSRRQAQRSAEHRCRQTEGIGIVVSCGS